MIYTFLITNGEFIELILNERTVVLIDVFLELAKIKYASVRYGSRKI